MAHQKGAPKTSGSGRKKGTPNKTTQLLKEAILEAATRAGDGSLVTYLHTQAVENPGPFLSLLGKVLPMQVSGEGPEEQIIVEIHQHARESSRGRMSG